MSDERPNRPGMVDWDLAVRVGSRLVGDGPQVSRSEAVEAVEELRAGAERSTPLVRDFTGLVASERTAPAAGRRPSRMGAGERRRFCHRDRAAGSRSSRKKKGAPGPDHRGDRFAHHGCGARSDARVPRIQGARPVRSLPPKKPGEQRPAPLVAPNIVHAERELAVDEHDFRLWVCLHEETHRVQFTAVPWMRDHLRVADGRDRRLGGDRSGGRLLSEGLRGSASSCPARPTAACIDLVSSPEQKSR